MKIFKIEINNYRLLKNFSIDLEKELSLVIGKNNTGKTSILIVLENFLNENKKFSFDDFNIEFKNKLKVIIENANEIEENKFKALGIKLKLYIEYNETDNLANVSRVMMDLDPNNNVIVLGFEYLLSFQGYIRLRKDYDEFSIKEITKSKEKPDYIARNLYDFLHQNHADYFKIHKKSFEYKYTIKSVIEENYIDLIKEEISTKDIINFKYISAKRDVANKEIDKTLSSQTSKIYKSSEGSDEQSKAIEEFKDKLSETDTNLSGIYKSLFDATIKKVKDFGGMKINETEIEIISTFATQRIT